jgi:hypothetical protein
MIVLGSATTDTNEMFTRVIGAARLSNGHLVVGDRPGPALREFGADGRLLRRYAHPGAGPGEVGHLAALMRCGDSLFTSDIQGDRISVFSADGRYVRTFRFASPGKAQRPWG